MSVTPSGQVMDHEYDGIREYDNPTPGWWHLIFIACIAFSITYYAYYHFSPSAKSIWDVHDSSVQADYQKKFGKLGVIANDETNLVRLMGNPEAIALGKDMFVQICAACHGQNGASNPSLPGVNLTDNAYKNVKSITEIFTVITKGAGSGAMPPWENRFGNDERVVLAAYVASLRGQNVSGGKAAEGAEIPPWPTAPGPRP